MVVDLETDKLEDVKVRLEEMEENIRIRLLFRGPGYVGPAPHGGSE